MIKKIKSFWNGLSSRTRKIIKTFIEAGLAYIGAYLAIGAGLAAVFNIKDKE